jgi:uncharacterized protein
MYIAAKRSQVPPRGVRNAAPASEKMRPMGNPVTYFEILGKDGDLLAGFYRDLFGWEVTPVEEGGAYSIVDTGSEQGIGGGIGAFEQAPSQVTVYVHADDVGAALERANELGATTVMPAREVAPGTEAALFADPEGHVVGIIRRA